MRNNSAGATNASLLCTFASSRSRYLSAYLTSRLDALGRLPLFSASSFLEKSVYEFRPYQDAILDQVSAAFEQGYMAPLVQSRTGSGKTIMFCGMARGAYERAFKVLILVHRIELIDQTTEKLLAMGVPHGIIAPGFPETNHIIQLASIQTFIRRMARFPVPDLVIFDEAHHCASETWLKVGRFLPHPKTRYVGFTATPERLDGKGLGKMAGGMFDVLINGPTYEDLATDNFLVPRIRIFCPPLPADLSGLRMRAGDYKREQLDGIFMDEGKKAKIVGCLIEHYTANAYGERAFAFCASVGHAQYVAKLFSDAGIPAVAIDGTMSKQERRGIVNGFKNGSFKILCSCDLISEGFDCPAASVGILARPTASFSLSTQQIGRILRPSDGKDCAIILDHVGNILKHGRPDIERNYSLLGAEKKEREKESTDRAAALRVCDNCFNMYEPAKDGIACPCCGALPKIRQPEMVDGQLVEIVDTDFETRRQLMQAKIHERIKQGMAQGAEELLKIAQERGYPHAGAWVKKVLKSREEKEAKAEQKRLLAEREKKAQLNLFEAKQA